MECVYFDALSLANASHSDWGKSILHLPHHTLGGCKKFNNLQKLVPQASGLWALVRVGGWFIIWEGRVVYGLCCTQSIQSLSFGDILSSETEKRVGLKEWLFRIRISSKHCITGQHCIARLLVPLFRFSDCSKLQAAVIACPLPFHLIRWTCKCVVLTVPLNKTPSPLPAPILARILHISGHIF